MDRITLQQLLLFLYLAEHPNLSQAASELHFSQPALSKSISTLEKRLGFPLFVRNNRGLSLTPVGKYLYGELQVPVQKIGNVIRSATEELVCNQKILRIGYPSSFDYNLDFNPVRSVVRQYRLLNPKVDVKEYLYEFVPLRNALLFSEVDLIIGQKVLAGELKGAQFKEIGPFPLYIAMSREHRLAGVEVLTPEMLLDETFLEVYCYEPSQPERAALTKMWGFSPKVEYVPNFQTLTRSLSQGNGISFCGHFNNVTTETELVFHRIGNSFPLNNSTIAVIWRENNVSAEAMNLINMFPQYHPDSL